MIQRLGFRDKKHFPTLNYILNIVNFFSKKIIKILKLGYFILGLNKTLLVLSM